MMPHPPDHLEPALRIERELRLANALRNAQHRPARRARPPGRLRLAVATRLRRLADRLAPAPTRIPEGV